MALGTLIVLFALNVPGINAQECAAGTAVKRKRNWYCSAVDSYQLPQLPREWPLQPGHPHGYRDRGLQNCGIPLLRLPVSHE